MTHKFIQNKKSWLLEDDMHEINRNVLARSTPRVGTPKLFWEKKLDLNTHIGCLGSHDSSQIIEKRRHKELHSFWLEIGHRQTSG